MMILFDDPCQASGTKNVSVAMGERENTGSLKTRTEAI